MWIFTYALFSEYCNKTQHEGTNEKLISSFADDRWCTCLYILYYIANNTCMCFSVNKKLNWIDMFWKLHLEKIHNAISLTFQDLVWYMYRLIKFNFSIYMYYHYHFLFLLSCINCRREAIHAEYNGNELIGDHTQKITPLTSLGTGRGQVLLCNGHSMLVINARWR